MCKLDVRSSRKTGIFQLWTSILQVVFASKWIFICTSSAGIKISEIRESWIKYTRNTLLEERAFFDGILYTHLPRMQGIAERSPGQRLAQNTKSVPTVLACSVPLLVREPAIRLRVNAFMLISCQKLLGICDPHRSTYEHVHTSSAPRPRGYIAPLTHDLATLGMSNSQLSVHTGPVLPSFLAFSSAEKPPRKTSHLCDTAQRPVRCCLRLHDTMTGFCLHPLLHAGYGAW